MEQTSRNQTVRDCNSVTGNRPSRKATGLDQPCGFASINQSRSSMIHHADETMIRVRTFATSRHQSRLSMAADLEASWSPALYAACIGAMQCVAALRPAMLRARSRFFRLLSDWLLGDGKTQNGVSRDSVRVAGNEMDPREEMRSTDLFAS